MLKTYDQSIVAIDEIWLSKLNNICYEIVAINKTIITLYYFHRESLERVFNNTANKNLINKLFLSTRTETLENLCENYYQTDEESCRMVNDIESIREQLLQQDTSLETDILERRFKDRIKFNIDEIKKVLSKEYRMSYSINTPKSWINEALKEYINDNE